MNGILNINKEAGYTSFDVVAKLRRILKEKKIGHTGTLDPAAQGVLPVCLGKATKISELLTEGKKAYEAVMLLGRVTDTLDSQGTVLEERSVTCSEEEVENCILSFRGEQEQIPPMYSALKVNGKRLYELARQGKTVERKSRKVSFYDIRVLEIKLPRVRFSVECSKGTYIRSLCDDIGQKLGCGACMEKLTRTHSDIFDIRDAFTIDEIESLMSEGRIADALIPIEKVLVNLPAARTLPQWDKPVHNGNKIVPKGCAAEKGFEDKQRIRIYDSQGLFIGIYEYSETEDILRPVKILYV